MSTKLTKNVSREAHSPSWGDLIVTLAPEGIYIREKWTSVCFGPVAFGVIYQMAAKIEAEANAKPRRKRVSRSLLSGR